MIMHTKSARIVRNPSTRSPNTPSCTALRRQTTIRASSAARTVRACRVLPQVVAVERDVERPDRHVDALEGMYAGGQPVGQRHPAGRNAEKDRAGPTGRLLENL